MRRSTLACDGQAIRQNFGAWRWYLYARASGEARLLPIACPPGPSRSATRRCGSVPLFLTGRHGQGATGARSILAATLVLALVWAIVTLVAVAAATAD